MRKLHISDNEIQKQARLIFNPILRGESATILCYPCCKIAYNLSSFLQRPTLLRKYLGQYHNKHEFIIITLEKNETLKSFLIKISRDNNSISPIKLCKDIIKKGKEPYFLILQADMPPPEIINQIITTLHSCILQLERVGGMIFFETNALSSKSIGKILQENNKFLQNVLYLPIYTKNERRIFLNNLANDWNIKPPKQLIEILSTSLGGSLWLLREGLRCYKDHDFSHINEILSSSGIKLRIHAILNQLTTSEKQYLMQICSGHYRKIPKEIQIYFSQIGLIENHDNKWSITIPILIPYLKELNESKLLTHMRNHIVFQNKDVSSFFSPQEKKILIVLLNRKGNIVSRELIAKALWKGEWEEMYSDWAIDKVISRLRQTLVTIGVSKNIIQVKKGRGIQI